MELEHGEPIKEEHNSDLKVTLRVLLLINLLLDVLDVQRIHRGSPAPRNKTRSKKAIRRTSSRYHRICKREAPGVCKVTFEVMGD